MGRIVAVGPVVFAVAVASSAAAQTAAATLTLATRPVAARPRAEPLRSASSRTRKGRPVTNADVALAPVDARRPEDQTSRDADGRHSCNNVGAGKYNGIAIVTMAGDWDVTVAASRNGKELARKTQRLTAYTKAPSKAK